MLLSHLCYCIGYKEKKNHLKKKKTIERTLYFKIKFYERGFKNHQLKKTDLIKQKENLKRDINQLLISLSASIDIDRPGLKPPQVTPNQTASHYLTSRQTDARYQKALTST